MRLVLLLWMSLNVWVNGDWRMEVTAVASRRVISTARQAKESRRDKRGWSNGGCATVVLRHSLTPIFCGWKGNGMAPGRQSAHTPNKAGRRRSGRVRRQSERDIICRVDGGTGIEGGQRRVERSRWRKKRRFVASKQKMVAVGGGRESSQSSRRREMGGCVACARTTAIKKGLAAPQSRAAPAQQHSGRERRWLGEAERGADPTTASRAQDRPWKWK